MKISDQRPNLVRGVTVPTLVSLGLLLGAAAGASTDTLPSTDRLEPWQVAITKSVTSTRTSPDGQHVAYTLAVPRRPLDDEDGRAFVELHVASLDGTSRPFITGEVNVSSVDWTPGGDISFLAKRGDDDVTALWSISPNGGEARKVLEHATSISSYSWSDDGTRVLYRAPEEKAEERKTLEDKGFDARIYEEDLTYMRAWVATLDEATGIANPQDDGKPLDVEGFVRAARFAPDGERVMLTVTPTPNIDDSYTQIKIHVVDLDTGATSKVDNPGKLGAVEFSPDGNWLAMITAADLNDPAAGRLAIAPADGGTPTDVLPDLEAHVSSFTWKNDRTLIAVVDQGAETELVEVTLPSDAPAGKAAELDVLVPAGDTIFTGMDLAGGTLSLTGQSPAHPGEAFTVVDGKPRRLTSSNDWLDDVPLARQEVIRYDARDGLEIEGVLIYPLDYQAGQRYPLLVIVHGGPESHFRDGWLTSYSNLGQVAAGRGFAVFYPNYRGSTGRGVEFSKVSQADAAGPEFDDYVDGVDHLIEIGLVDRDRVGITGGSYGGYASAWAATYYSDRFAAAAPFVGISNNISKVGTTDIPQEMYDVHHRKWLWDDWDYFAERSPIYWIKRNRTATLVLHGEDDPRVHPSQSLELYRHLKVLGQAPARLVLYPGEGHGNRRAASQIDYTLRVLRWMEHFVRDGGTELPDHEIDYADHLPWANSDDDAPQSSDGEATGGR